MRNYIDAKDMMSRAYVSLAADALKNGVKKDKEGVIRCCECGRPNATLRKIYDRRYARAERPNGHDDIYACEECIKERALQEAAKERKKLKES